MRYSVPRKHKPIKPRLGTFECRECSKTFDGLYTYNRLVICSEECRGIRYRRKRKEIQARYYAKHPKTPVPRDCALCDTNFQPRTRHDARFCTPKCYMRSSQIATNYNLTVEEYRAVLKLQGDKCAGCGVEFGGATPYIDHSHKSGKFRGLLHNRCNTVLGFVNDDPNKLEKLAAYLRGTG